MPEIAFEIDGAAQPLDVRVFTGVEALGEPSRFELEVFSSMPLEAKALLRKRCVIGIEGDAGSRTLRGVVTRVSSIAVSHAELGRTYRFVVESSIAALRYRRKSHVFQNQTVPQIVTEVLKDAGFVDEEIDVTHATGRPTRRYVVQFKETDLAFVRRLCEEDGLYFRIEARDAHEVFVLFGDSRDAKASPIDALPILDEDAAATSDEHAKRLRWERTFAPGKVAVRGYDFTHPTAKLEGESQSGNAVEKAYEVFEAPARLADPKEEKQAADRILEATRAGSRVLAFDARAVRLAIGDKITLHPGADYEGVATADGDFFVTSIAHRWRAGTMERPEVAVRAVDAKVRYRLPIVTPRPIVPGFQQAFVTGASGAEIHTEEHGRVNVRFPWDRKGPNDDGSSVPVRVSQPNTPGSMMIPRVGWEVVVAFEDGDADRPICLGRLYNGKQMPPYKLPASKTMSTVGSVSSPGGGAANTLMFEDLAGKMHMLFSAGKDMAETVANDFKKNVAVDWAHNVKGSVFHTISSNVHLSVGDAIELDVGNQFHGVLGLQRVSVTGSEGVSTSVEMVGVGGLLIEKVGNPVDGFKNWLKAAILAAPGFITDAMNPGFAQTAVGWAGKALNAASAIHDAMQGSAGPPPVAPFNPFDPHDWTDPTKLHQACAVAGAVAGTVPFVGGALSGAAGVVPTVVDNAPKALTYANKYFPSQTAAAEQWVQQNVVPRAKAAGAAALPVGEKALTLAKPYLQDAAQTAPGVDVKVAAVVGGAATTGAGHGTRTVTANAHAEIITKSLTHATPGSASWAVKAAELLKVDGSFTTKCTKYGVSITGNPKFTSGSLSITARSKDIAREAKGPFGNITTDIGGAMKLSCQNYLLESKKSNVQVEGESTYKLDADELSFIVGDSKVTISGGLVYFKTAKLIVKNPTKTSEAGAMKP